MKAKTKKAFAKRIKVTKTGKMLIRKGGQDHFNSRDTGTNTNRKRRDSDLSESFRHSVKSLLPNDPV
jgi:ribosomal protein L35